MTIDLFGEELGRDKGICIDVPDSDVSVWPELFSTQESDRFMRLLSKNINWKQEEIKMFGKVHNVPRLTAWYGEDAACSNLLVNISVLARSAATDSLTKSVLKVYKGVLKARVDSVSFISFKKSFS